MASVAPVIEQEQEEAPYDVLLMVEVSDSTLRYDRKVKSPLYACRGIPEVWLINMPEQQLEVYRQPGPAGYREIVRPTTEESIALSQLHDIVVRVGDLFMS